MPAEPIGIAVVGLGFGAVHARAFACDPRSQLVALCGRDAARTCKAAEDLGFQRHVTDWRRVVDDEAVALVSLAVPAPAQVEIAHAALTAGKHVFFEKPLAGDVTRAQQLARLASERGLVTAINFEFPEVPAFREARRLLDAGALGALRHVAVSWRVETYANRAKLDGWKTDAAAGGGALNLFASHSLYYLEWLLGPMHRLSATLARAPGDSREADTLNAIVLESADGLPVVLTIAIDAYLGPGHRIDLYGEEGTMVLDNPGADYLAGFRLWRARRPDAQLREVALERDAQAGSGDGRVCATAAIQRRMLDAIAHGGGSVVPAVAEGVRVEQLLDCARHAARTHARVDVPPLRLEGK